MRRQDLLCNMDDTIAAISTPLGEAGIGIVRLSGKKAISIADKIFASKNKSRPSAFKTYTVHYGHVVNPVGGHGPKGAGPSKGVKDHQIIDEVILTVMKAPKSYTKEDVVEINCHGGIVPLRKTLDLVLSLGARLAQPGEFTKRAFINGRIDLAQAEAVLDLIRSKTENSMKVALGQLEGELSKKINIMREEVLNVLAEIEAQIDFSEEDIEFTPNEANLEKLASVSKEIKRLIDDTWKGMIMKEGILSVICGKPNVGKSSLMNVLLRKSRVIVTSIPGTTRDAIEEEINLSGIPIRIVDTAGISAAKGIIEEHGMRKSKSYIKMANLILFMLDLSRPWSSVDREIFDSIRSKNFITIANKSDLPRKLNLDKVKKIIQKDEIIEISLLKRNNLDEVERTMLRKIWRGEILHPEGTLVTNLRHKKNLELAYKCISKAIRVFEKEAVLPERTLRPSPEKLRNAHPEIIASDLKEAVYFLGSVLGDTVEPDILDRIFLKFCIGK